MSNPRFEIFSGVPSDDVAALLRALPVQQFPAGEVLLREHSVNECVYLIEEGELDVWKGSPSSPVGVQVARLKSGDCFGEMSVISSLPSSASVIARTTVMVRVMTFAQLPAKGETRELITANLARTLVLRLYHANEEIQAKNQRELKAMELVAVASGFITHILVGLTFYVFSLPLVVQLVPLIPTDSLISFFFVAVFSWITVKFMNSRPHVRERDWHMTLKAWPSQIAKGVGWALPLMLIFSLFKFGLMEARPGQLRFWDPMAAVEPGAPLNFPFWFLLGAIYTILCFGQEFIRCATQGTLIMIDGAFARGGRWKSILVSDVMFASLHMHMGTAFAAQAFIAGLFFGFEFYREKSYLAVAVTHALVGLYAVFIVGIPR